MFNVNMEIIDVAPRPKELVWVDFGHELKENYIIRKESEENKGEKTNMVIGIIGAMAEEVESLKKIMKVENTMIKAGMEFLKESFGIMMQ